MSNPMTPHTCTLRTGQARYWIGGPAAAEAPTLLLLHSAFSDAEFSWSPVWEELSRKFHVVAPDMPGFGASEAPARLDLPTMASALHELMEKLGVRKATVVGNSLGVAVAIALAEHYPGSVSRLVLVNGVTLPKLPALLKLVIRIPFVDQALTGVLWRVAFGRKAIRDSFPHASREELDRIKAVVLKSARRHFITAKVCTLHSPQARPDSRVPATLLWGADDRLTSLQVAAELGQRLPGSELVRVERAGHLPQMDQPAEFTARLCAIAGAGA